MALLGLGKKRHAPARVDRRQSRNEGFVPRREDLTVADYANGVPNIRLSKAVQSFARQLPWIIILFIIGAAIAFYLTKDMKRTYAADATIMVQLGDEYVYQPVGEQGGQSALQLTPDSIVLTEIGIMKNSAVIDRVVGKMTETDSDSVRFDKKAHNDIRSAISRNSEEARIEAIMERRKRVEAAFVVFPSPKSSIINLSYKHQDPAVSVKAANSFIDEYVEFRKQVFVDGASDVISQRRIATEQQLGQNERSIARFLKTNNVSDFDSEQNGVRGRTEALKTDLNATRASIAETEASLAIVEDQLRKTSPTIDLYRDDRASQRIAQAELELAQLLSKYLPNSNPVRDKQAELSQLRSVQSGYNGQATGGRRVGPNPVYQTLTTRRNELQAAADSLREKEFTLQRQLDSADAKVRRLAELFPEYQNLLRERTTLASRLSTYNAKEQEALINQKQAEAASENVKIISRPSYATKGRNMRALSFLIASVFWGFTLVMIALARVFLDPRNFAPRTSAGSRNAQMNASNRVQPVYADPIPEPISPAEAPQYVPVYEPQNPTPYEPAAQNYSTQAWDQSYASGQNQTQSDYNTDYNSGGVPSYNATSDYHNASPQMSFQDYPEGNTAGVYQPSGSSAAHDMYPNPYAPVLSTAEAQKSRLHTQADQGMNVLGTIPPDHSH